jgi:replication factor C subunit 1
VEFQAMYASVLPGEYMRGSMSQMIQFPQWLGKNSTTNKNDRILQELRTHMALQ